MSIMFGFQRASKICWTSRVETENVQGGLLGFIAFEYQIIKSQVNIHQIKNSTILVFDWHFPN